MLSFAPAWEEAETLEEISYERDHPRTQHLGIWVLHERGTWADLLVAVRVRDYARNRWTPPHWHLTRWRRQWDIWRKTRDMRFKSRAFKDLFCWGGPLKWAHEELEARLGESRDLGDLVVPVFRRVPS